MICGRLGAGRLAALLPARRRKDGLAYVEGEKLVREALDGTWHSRLVIVEEGFSGSPEGLELLDLANSRGVEAVATDEKSLRRLTSCETPPPAGVIVEPPDIDLGKAAALPSKLLILDRVSDPGNAGTLTRTAIAFGFAAVTTLGGVRPTNEKFLRSSAGLCFAPGRIFTGGEAASLANFLHQREFQTVLLDPYAPGFLEDFAADPSRRLALVVGNESTGVDRQVWRSATALRIQMSPLAESLNAAVAGAIALHHFRVTPPRR